MAKINYEDDGKFATVKMDGKSTDLFRGICRIAAHAKKKILTKGDKTFEELLLDGIKVAELENELNDLNKDEKNFSVDTLVELLEKLLND